MNAKLIFGSLFLLVFVAVGLRAEVWEADAIYEEASKLTKNDIPSLRQRAESGDAKAQLLLGRAYSQQFGVKRNYKEAMKWYLRSAEQGNRVAQFQVCNMYQFGHGVGKNADTAIDWCRRAADQGLAEAQARLGVLFGLKKVYAESAVWTRKAAEQGYFEAQMNLAHDYTFGQGVPQDDTTAYMWLLLSMAAQCGEPPQRCVEKDPSTGAFAEQGRETVAPRLSSEQVAEARRRASEWLVAHQKEPLPAEETEAKMANFFVAHEHGAAMFIPGGSYGLDHCFGWITIGKGTVRYANRRGHDAVEIPIAQIKQVKGVTRAMGGATGVELQLENGKKYSFYPINDQFESLDRQPLLDALEREMGRRRTQAAQQSNEPATAEAAPRQGKQTEPAGTSTSEELTKKQALLSAKRVAVVNKGPGGGAKGFLRGFMKKNLALNADASRAKKQVQTEITKWNRYTLVDDPSGSDLVFLITESNRHTITGECLVDKLQVFKGGEKWSSPANLLWSDQLENCTKVAIYPAEVLTAKCGQELAGADLLSVREKPEPEIPQPPTPAPEPSAAARPPSGAVARPPIKLVTREASLGKSDPRELVKAPAVSSDSKRVAYVLKRRGKWLVAVDGVEGKEYDDVGDPLFSPDGKRVAFAAKRGGKSLAVVDGAEGKEYDALAKPGIAFSPDSKRVAYGAERGGKWFAVVDGVEDKREYDSLASPVFSPDSWRIGYPAKPIGRHKLVVVLDGGETSEYDLALFPVFSPDSRRVAYWAKRGDKWFVVADNVEGGQYESVADPVFSPDSRRIAYWAKRGDKQFVVVDNVEGGQYDSVTDPVFSPDSRRIAYWAKRGDKQFIVLGNVEGGQYDSVAAPVFSPDSKRVAYAAARGGKWFVVVDGVEGRKYDAAMNPSFSPDSNRVAYVAHQGHREFAVVDGVEGREYDAILGLGVVFSPDSRRIAYGAERQHKPFVVVDGAEGKEYDGLAQGQGPIFSPDSRHVAYGARYGQERFLVIDGLEGKRYDRFVRDSKLTFDGPNVLRALVLRGEEILRVEIEIETVTETSGSAAGL